MADMLNVKELQEIRNQLAGLTSAELRARLHENSWIKWRLGRIRAQQRQMGTGAFAVSDESLIDERKRWLSRNFVRDDITRAELRELAELTRIRMLLMMPESVRARLK